MAKELQIRRGTTQANDLFIGKEGELSMDTTTKGIRIHDGQTAGGFMIDVVVVFQAPSAANNYTWYRKYSSGWVEQGGQFTAISVADGSGTAGNNIINLPIKMANDRYWYSANTQVGINGWHYANGVILDARTTTTLTLKVVAGAYDSPLYWEVKGMAA